MSENKIWSSDPAPEIAALEDGLTIIGSGYLMRVHLDVLTALELPAQTVGEIKAAYQAEKVVRKADEPWFTAQKKLSALRGYGTSPIPPSLYGDLVEAVTSKWYAEGRLEDRVQQQIVATWLTTQLQLGKKAPPRLEYQGEQKYVLEYAQAQASQYVSSLNAATRREIALAVYQAEQSRASPQALSDTLLERFSTLNRDWRRIAVSEISTNRSNATLAAYPEGTEFEYSAAKDACRDCLYHHGKTYTLVSPEAAKDAAKEIWIGKPPRPKGVEAKDWVRIGMHPLCRCRWIPKIRQPAPNADIEKRIQDILKLARKF